jgi:hypothetical protein
VNSEIDYFESQKLKEDARIQPNSYSQVRHQANVNFFKAKKNGEKSSFKRAIIDLKNAGNIMSEKQMFRVSKF